MGRSKAAASATRPWAAKLLNESQLETESGETLFRKVWRPSAAESKGNPPAALVFVTHGAGEHCMRYEVLAKALNAHNIVVFAHDHVGHGRSSGKKRFQIDDFRIYVRDALADIELTRLSYPDLPFFMFGTSMGGLITLLSSLERPHIFSGIVLSAPAIVPDPATATPAKVCLARLFAKRCPDFGVGRMNKDFITRDPEQLRQLKEDPWNYKGKAKARWAVQILDHMNEITTRLGEISVPFLCVQGSNDKMTTATGAEMLESHSARLGPHSAVRIYPGMLHDLLHDIDGENVLKDIVNWILRVTAGVITSIGLPKAGSTASTAPALMEMVDTMV